MNATWLCCMSCHRPNKRFKGWESGIKRRGCTAKSQNKSRSDQTHTIHISLSTTSWQTLIFLLSAEVYKMQMLVLGEEIRFPVTFCWLWIYGCNHIACVYVWVCSTWKFLVGQNDIQSINEPGAASEGWAHEEWLTDFICLQMKTLMILENKVDFQKQPTFQFPSLKPTVSMLFSFRQSIQFVTSVCVQQRIIVADWQQSCNCRFTAG